MEKLFLNDKIKNFEKGTLYFLFVTKLGSYQSLFTQKNLVFINSFFDEAIKVPLYIRKNPFHKSKLDSFMSKFNLKSINIDNIGLLNQMIFIILNEAIKNDILIVETTGLANDSIEYLLQFSSEFILNNPEKTIYIVHFTEFTHDDGLYIIDNACTFDEILIFHLKSKKK